MQCTRWAHIHAHIKYYSLQRQRKKCAERQKQWCSKTRESEKWESEECARVRGFFVMLASIEIEAGISLFILPHFCKYKLVVSGEFMGASLLRIFQNLLNETKKREKGVRRENGFGLHTSGAVWNFTTIVLRYIFSRYRIWLFYFWHILFPHSIVCLCAYDASCTTIAIHRLCRYLSAFGYS